jgi:hypothetical protein
LLPHACLLFFTCWLLLLCLLFLLPRTQLLPCTLLPRRLLLLLLTRLLSLPVGRAAALQPLDLPAAAAGAGTGVHLLHLLRQALHPPLPAAAAAALQCGLQIGLWLLPRQPQGQQQQQHQLNVRQPVC